MLRLFSAIATWTILAVINSPLSAQPFSPVFIPFSVNGQELPNALAGGLNNPQLSEVDFNNDGIMDLFVFDRQGNVILPFLHDGVPGSPHYTYAPEYTAGFPPLSNWVLLRDFNGDGIADLFAYSNVPGIDGIMVWRGYYDEQDRIAFRQVMFPNPYRLIYFPLPNGSSTQLFVTRIDYPAVVDVDGDGDLDILTFGVAGGYMEYYANRSIEMGLGTDTLVYRLASTCWGGFYESGFTEAVDLAAAPGQCFSPLLPEDGPIETRHAGSTILAFDANGNGVKDLVLGDISFNNLNFLSNGGTPSLAWFTNQDNFFPSYDVPVSLPVFPVAFLIDLDRDGKKDLAVAPNASSSSEDRVVLWWYRNPQGVPYHFELRQRNFLVETMIDLGTGANPAFADVNGDGLTDLLIGNGSFYQPFGVKASRLFLFLNVGTATEPAFQLADDDFLGMSQIAAATFNLAPAFGDIDGDGDVDLLVGEDFGMMYYFENLAGPGNPMQFAAHQYPYMNIDVGIASTPFLFDLNRDGRTDLIIGNRTGILHYFPNTGTPGLPFFQAELSAPNVAFLGRVDARAPGFFSGYSAPVVLEADGEFQLFTGSEQGRIRSFSVWEADFEAPFPLLSDNWGGIAAGARSRPAFADLDSDGLLEVAVGNERGGIHIFATDLPAQAPNPVAEMPAASEVRVFPNPAREEVFFSLPEGFDATVVLQIFSSDGRLLRQALRWEPVWQESLVGLPAGLYFWRIQGKSGTYSGKVVKR